MRPGRLIAAAVAVVATAAAVTWLRRRTGVEPRADLFFEDGSSLSLDRDAPEAERLFALARALAGPAA